MATGDKLVTLDGLKATVKNFFGKKAVDIDLPFGDVRYTTLAGYLNKMSHSRKGNVAGSASYTTSYFRAEADCTVYADWTQTGLVVLRISNTEPVIYKSSDSSTNFDATAEGNALYDTENTMPTKESPATVLKGQYVAIYQGINTYTIHVHYASHDAPAANLPLSVQMESEVRKISEDVHLSPNEYTDELEATVNGAVKVDTGIFEIGNVSITTGGGWNYTSSNKYVRMKQGNTFSLFPGDVISLTDYSDAVLRVGRRTFDQTTYSGATITQEDYIVQQPGEFLIVLSKSYPSGSSAPENDLTKEEAEALKKLVRVTRANSLVNISSGGSNVKGINHRGFSVFAPENSLPAFAESKRRGFEWVETDIAFTSDCVPVLLHDESINRVARTSGGAAISGTVNIAEITLAQANTYDFGAVKGTDYAGLKICKFEDLLKFAKLAGLGIYAEIKATGITNGSGIDANIQICTDMVKRYGMEDKVTWISFTSSYLGIVKAKLPEARLGLIGPYSETLVTNAASLKTNNNEVFADVEYAADMSDAAAALLSAGIPMEVYTVDMPNNLAGIDPYVTGVTTNYLNVPVMNWIAAQKMLTANS